MTTINLVILRRFIKVVEFDFLKESFGLVVVAYNSIKGIIPVALWPFRKESGVTTMQVVKRDIFLRKKERRISLCNSKNLEPNRTP